MKIPKSNLLEDVKKCMTDPIYDIIQNFSLEKSREGYKKRVKQWESGWYSNNPAAKEETVSFPFTSLSEMGLVSIQAHNLYVNLKKESFNKWVDWYVYGQNIVVSWYRLKTFDEWLHDGIKDAIIQASDNPEDGVRLLLEKKLGGWVYHNTTIHLFAEWVIDEETLKRLWTYEKYQSIKGRDIEEDIEQAKKALEDMKENNNVTVLTLKM